jgi:hypothetical protein
MFGLDVFNYGHSFHNEDGAYQDAILREVRVRDDSQTTSAPTGIETSIRFGSQYEHTGTLIGGRIVNDSYPIAYEIFDGESKLVCERFENYSDVREGERIYNEMLQIATRTQDTPQEKCDALRTAATGGGITAPARDFTPTVCTEEGYLPDPDTGECVCGKSGYSLNQTTGKCEQSSTSESGLDDETKKLLVYGFLGLLGISAVSLIS